MIRMLLMGVAASVASAPAPTGAPAPTPAPHAARSPAAPVAAPVAARVAPRVAPAPAHASVPSAALARALAAIPASTPASTPTPVQKQGAVGTVGRAIAQPPAAASTISAKVPAAPSLSFAAILAQRPPLDGPAAWIRISEHDAWTQLATAPAEARQPARWDYARSLIADARWAEALGVLDVMRQDDADLAMVDAWRIAYGAALTGLRRTGAALGVLTAPTLARNPEACLWRMRALGEASVSRGTLGEVGLSRGTIGEPGTSRAVTGRAGTSRGTINEAGPSRPVTGDASTSRTAIDEVRCAAVAVNARSARDRRPFLLAAARAAIDGAQPALALTWLQSLADRDPAANLLRGRALMGLHEVQAGRLRLARAEESGHDPDRFDARVSRIEGLIANHVMTPAEAIRQLDAIRYTWRGGDVERRALLLDYRLATGLNRRPAALRAGAALLRYFDLGDQGQFLLAEVQGGLAALLAPDSAMPLGQAAGLYWDLRDLAPSGAAGDLLVNRLADRLQAGGLYARAADLLRYQLTMRVKDVAQGPLSVRVATLDILAGRADRAIVDIRMSEGPIYSSEMLGERARILAVALQQRGKPQEAIAVLDGVPDSNGIKSEILWKQRDWPALIGTIAPALPGPGELDDIGQATVLRYAVALAMLGREADLQQLRARYTARFAQLPCAAAFEILTRTGRGIDVARLSRAMALIPAASPAGPIGDLLDVQPAAAGTMG